VIRVVGAPPGNARRIASAPESRFAPIAITPVEVMAAEPTDFSPALPPWAMVASGPPLPVMIRLPWPSKSTNATVPASLIDCTDVSIGANAPPLLSATLVNV